MREKDENSVSNMYQEGKLGRDKERREGTKKEWKG